MTTNEVSSDTSTQPAEPVDPRWIEVDQFAQRQVEATSENGLVTVVLTAIFAPVSLRIDPVCIDPQNPQRLQDLIVATYRQCHAQAALLQITELPRALATAQTVKMLVDPRAISVTQETVRLARCQVEARSEDGLVTVVLSGVRNLVSLRIDPQGLNPHDPQGLQDRIVATLWQCQDEVTAEWKPMNSLCREMGLTCEPVAQPKDALEADADPQGSRSDPPDDRMAG